MNSTQLNFFTDPSDWSAILKFLEDREIKQIKEPILEPRKIQLLDASNRLSQQPKMMLMTTKRFSEHLFFEYNEKENLYSINRIASYLIEFSPGGFFPKNIQVLDRGRFYSATTYYASNGEKVQKSQEFRDWLKRIYTQFKKEFLVKRGDEKVIFFSRAISNSLNEGRGIIDPGYTRITYDA